MTPHLFFVDPVEFTRTGETITVSGEEGRHAVTVKRIRVGEIVTIADGAGRSITAPVVETRGRDELVVARGDVVETVVRSPRVSVLQAAIKADRLEAAVEMLTEVGVDEIVVFTAERTSHQCASPRQQQRIYRRVREAAKQSRSTKLPNVAFADSLVAALGDVANPGQLVVLDSAGDTRLAELPAAQVPALTVVVGPEGGLTSDEIESVRSQGARVVRIGASVLRANTAGLAAVSALFAASGRW